jgi:hypothetical protein
MVINPSVFVRHLFLRPGYNHYYFGDYYSSNYADAGYSPWFSYQSSRRGYDPIYANQRWQHRSNQEWEQRTEANYRNLRENENARPPRNWAAQTALAEHVEASNRRNIAVAAQLQELAQRQNAQLRFQQVDPSERQQYDLRGQEYRKYLHHRQQAEAYAARTPGVGSAAATGSGRRTFSRSPFVAPSAAHLGRDYAPPQRHQVLKPDFQVQPQPRIRREMPGTRAGSRPTTAAGQPGRSLVSPQAQPPRQGVNQGNRQRASAGQSQGPRVNRGNNRQGASNGQQQGTSEKKPADKSKK